MSSNQVRRSPLEQEVVDALLESNAINFEAVGAVLAKYGHAAAKYGVNFGVITGRHVADICIPPDPWRNAGAVVVEAERQG